MSAVVRPFALPDRASLEEAINAVCAEGRWMSTPRFQPTPAWAHALNASACPRHLLLLVEDAGRIVGWCRLFSSVGCDGYAREAELGIGLLPEYRECGLGRAMVGQALNWAAKKGVQRVMLTTRGDNSRAIHLFDACGFRVVNQAVDGWTKMVCQPLLRRG